MFNCSDFLTSHQCAPCTDKNFATIKKCIKLKHTCKIIRKSEVKCIKCGHCKIESYSILWILHHQKNCPNLKKFQCEQCDFKGRDKHVLNRHKISKHIPHSLINWHECEDCGFKAKFLHNLKEHVIRIHSTTGEFACDQCAFKGQTSNSLKYHKRFHQGLGNYVKCEKCNFKTKYPFHLRRHLVLKHTENVQKKFQCGQCPFQAHLLCHLKQHRMYKHTPDDLVEWVTCDECNFKTKWSKDLRQHIIRHRKRIKCDQCMFAAKLKLELKYHMIREHSNDGKYIYECHDCVFTTYNKDYLRRHRSSKHACNK